MTLAPRLLLAVLLLAGLPIVAQQDDKGDREAIRALIAKEIDGWAKFDAHQVASCYKQDVIWQNPFGVRIHSRKELESFLKNLFSRPGYRSANDTAPAKILDIRQESPTVWTVWSDESSKGQIDDASGKPMAPRHSFYIEVVVKTPQGFQISEMMIMDEKNP